ncbi:pilus assembly protein [Thioalkalivibrio sp. ALJT]|uniref:pilus assembly protein n=1 Tax=Thioalkalivibrio sp. ALJT TaxID=1158146 RepID=UPI000475F9A9|nr:PilC/PilY family type IV pilus protein [Thioalkalivibrio sp. ALJT]
MASHRDNTPTARPPRLSRSRIAIAVAAATMAFSGTAHGINLASTPLFLLDSGLPPNILFIPDTSESMQESPDGRLAMDQDNPLCQPGPDLDPDIDYDRDPADDICPAGARHPNSKGSIVKRVGLDLLDQYEGQVNLGLMSYQQMPASNTRNAFNSGGTVRWRLAERAIDVRISTEESPDFYDEDFEGAWDSGTKRFRVAAPGADGLWLFFNDGVPGYWWDTGESWRAVPTIDQEVFFDRHDTGGADFDSMDAYERVELQTSWWGQQSIVFRTSIGSFNVFLVDSQRQRNIDSWGEVMVSLPMNQLEWRNTESPGLGYLHVPIGGLNQDGSIDSDHWDAIRTKLQPQRHDWNGTGNPMTDASWPLIASGLTPLEGTMQTARDYFLDFVHPEESGDMTGTAGSSFGNNQGRNNADPIPRSCGVNAAIWVTDGLPSVASDGTALGADLPQALEEAQQAVADFHNDTQVDTYIVGFAMPAGVSGISGMPENPLNLLAEAGGTGTAFDATDEASLDAAMTQIFEAIIAEATGSASSVAAAATTYQEEDANFVYQALFNSADWSGDLVAYDFLLDDLSFSEEWRASENLPPHQERNIFSHDGSEGILFQWDSSPGAPGLSSEQQDILSSAPVVTGATDRSGEDLLAFLRGSAVHETRNGGEWRNRPTPLGDFINSNPAVQTPSMNFGYFHIDGYSKFREDNQDVPEVVYVGGNAGMLHAFDGESGEELFAYVPNAVFDKLPDLADPDYSHQFFVDGQQTITHAKVDGEWSTVLVGTLGAGGRGIYALDVTDPTSFSADNILWELSGDDLDALGYTFGAPEIAQTANGEWSVLFPNGYGSNDESAVLMIANLESGNVITIETDATGDNGLSEALFRQNAAGVITDGFAGDLQGNLWRLNLLGDASSLWSAHLHFQATGPNGETQPITARPAVGSHPNGGSIVMFGTGKYLENADIQVPDPAPVQSFYGIRQHEAIQAPVSRGKLLQHEFIGSGVVGDFSVRATTAGDNFDGSIHDGWYIDLDYPSPRGERVVEPAQIVDGRVEFVTLTPSDDPCDGGGTSSIVALNAATGSRPAEPVFDLTGDGEFGEDDMIIVGDERVPVSSIDPGIGIMSAPTIVRSSEGITRIISGTESSAPRGEPGPPRAFQLPRTWIQLR